MKMSRIMAVLMLSAVAVGANAQAEAKMKELQAQGFGARNTAAQAAANNEAVAEVAEGDTDPSFPGGEMFLQAYLKKKLMHSGVSGKGDVVISFKVDKKGNIYGAEVTQSAGSTLDTAAFNIVTGMPRWKPGLTNGEPADKPAQVTVSFGKED
ncbi:MAG: TonB family protein [Bacteroidaceae bacterium]|nr:TonB family protein [Bacteroidaceae bacterium]